LTSDFFRSLNRGANGSGFLPDRDGNTELMSPTSFVNVDTARRNVDWKTPFIVFNKSKVERKRRDRFLHQVPNNIDANAMIYLHPIPTHLPGRYPGWG
jgi:hypothetical protein